MPRRDRLLSLSMLCLALRAAGLTSPGAVVHATPEQLARLHRHRAQILDLVGQRHPDVMRAPLLPPEPIDWQVATITANPGTRHLWVTRGSAGQTDETLVSLSSDAGDAEGERRAWRAPVGALVG